MEIIKGADALAVAKSVLAETGIPVFVRVPAQRPERFIVVDIAGGSRRNLVTDSALIIVQAWDESADGKARSLVAARQCISLLEASRGRGFTAGTVRAFTNPSYPAWLPDPDTGIARFQFTGELRVIAGANR